MALSEASSDVAALWENALDAYIEISKNPIRSVLSSQRSVATITEDQKQQLETFKDFRHNKGKVDRLRSIISDNASYIQCAAEQIANAASTAFPPSVAILTAFSYVMTASKHVSDGYDMIESFFDHMQSFFRRLSLLEGKIPARKEFQIDLINVFSSMLAITGYASMYSRVGRLRAWASALVNGKDMELQKAYDSLHENLMCLEKATMIQTLRTAIDTYDDMKAISEMVKCVQESVDKNSAVNQETLTIAKSTNSGVNWLLRRSQEREGPEQELLRILKGQSKETQSQNQLKPSRSRPANFARLKQLLGTAAEASMQRRQAELDRACIRRVFEWIESDPAFLDIVNKRERFLWVSGASGMGKSTMAFKMVRYLKEMFSGDPSVCIACFFFDQEYPEICTLLNVLRWCSINAAERDAGYCEATLRDLRRQLYAVGDSTSEIDEEWRILIESKYSNDSKRRLIWVLDGIDETSDEDSAKLAELFNRVQRQNCQIQIIVTSDPSRDDYLSPVFSKRIELVKDRIAGDMLRFASSQTKNLPRLQKLGANLRKSVVKKVSARADSFLFIAHAMRRLDGLGYEGPVRRELENLPANTAALYETLLNDCWEHRNLEDREVLRSLLAWLAYAKSKLSFGGAVLLIDVIRKEKSLSMDEAFDGPLARLLRISGTGDWDDRDTDSSESEADWVDSDDSEDITGMMEDADSFLHFQERSLRAYFLQAINDPHGLRCTAQEAHIIIFKIVSAILTLKSEYGATVMFTSPKARGSAAQRSLTFYAATWALAHLEEIGFDEVSDDLAKGVLESLFSILSNKNKCLKNLETFVNEGSTIFNVQGAKEDKIVATLGSWARRALRMSPGSLAYEVLEWFRPLAEEPRRVFILIAQAHINNWFSAENVGEAYLAFSCAHSALLQGKDLPELQRNEMLRQYFEEFEQNGQKINETSFEATYNAFEDIPKTPMSFLGISMAMFCRSTAPLHKEAIKQADIGLGIGTILEIEQFWLFQCKGEIFFEIACLEENEKERVNYLGKTVDTLGTAIKMYHKIEEANEATQNDRLTMVYTFTTHARAAARLGKLEFIMGSIKEAVNLQLDNVADDALLDIISAFTRANQHQRGIEILKTISKANLTDFLIGIGTRNYDTEQEAAKRSGEARWLLVQYAGIVKALAANQQPDASFIKNYVQINAACFARQAIGDSKEAKKLLREVVHDPRADFRLVELACHRLSELLFEDFRLSGDPKAKMAALEETKELRRKLIEVLGGDCKVAELKTTVTLAFMLRKLGPTLELADILQAAFQSCVDLLTDDIGTNDSESLRRLALILGFVGKFEEEAQLALTAQLYVLDKDIREKELAAQKVSGEMKQEEKEEGDVSAEVSVLPGDSTGEDRSGTSVPEEPTTLADDMAEGLLSDAGFYCNSCGEVIRDWAHGGAHLCLYCIDCDICEKCFAKKEAREKGEMEPDWRVICPQDHRHIKAPLEGWRGVKDGILKIGDNETPFREWLKKLV